MTEVLSANDVAMKFDQKYVFKDVDFVLEQGTKTALLGENGSGKTTLTRIILGMLEPTAGSVKLGKIKGRPVQIGYVPQFREIDRDYPLSIASFVELNGPRFKNKAYQARVADVMEKTHLTKIAGERLGKASGGQRQRAYLAQALMDDPDLIILDEATASLDPMSKKTLLEMLDELNRTEGMTILFTTHDLELAHTYMTDYLLLGPDGMKSGKMRDFDYHDLEVE